MRAGGWTAALLIGLLVGISARAETPAAPGASDAKPATVGPLTLKDFLAPPDLSQVKLSPSGRSIIMIRRVGELDQLLKVDLPDFKSTVLLQTSPATAQQVKDKSRQEISYVNWKSDDTLAVSVDTPILFDGNWRFVAPIHLILKTDAASAPIYLNTAIHNGRRDIELSWIQDMLKDDPGHIMIGVRHDLDRQQLFRVDIHTGERTLLETADGSVISFGTDRKGDILTRTIEHDDGSLTLQGRAPGETKWTKVFDFRRKDERALEKFEPLGMSNAQTLFIAVKPETAADGDTKVVRTYDLKTQTLGPVVWSNPTYDVDSVVLGEDSHTFMAGCYWVDTLQCEFKTPKLTANLKGLNKFFDNKRNLQIVSQSDDDGQWIIYASGPDEPGAYFVYDVQAHHLQQLGVIWPDLSSERLGQMRRLDYKSRDGAPLSAYVTLPPGPSKGPFPLIVMPHGGPETRDSYAYDTLVQFLATRGYAVLQPNFRGSGGFGHKFAEAGYGEWGGRMHDDVMDATNALIAGGQIDPKRVCIVGGSYGGYEALYAAAREAKTFRCAVSLDGVSDLVSDLKSSKRYGRDSVAYHYWLKSQGDPETSEARMVAHSPVNMAKDWSTPLLLIHGDADQIVSVDQSRMMRRALQFAGKPVQYLEVKGMGHGPSTDDEVTKVYGQIEAFLAPYLGSDAAAHPATPKP